MTHNVSEGSVYDSPTYDGPVTTATPVAGSEQRVASLSHFTLYVVCVASCSNVIVSINPLESKYHGSYASNSRDSIVAQDKKLVQERRVGSCLSISGRDSSQGKKKPRKHLECINNTLVIFLVNAR